MARKTQRARPVLEGLEPRRLLSGKGDSINEQDLAKYDVQIRNLANGSTVDDRRMFFDAPGGGRIVLNLYGLGTLEGTTQDPDGALNIVYNNTNRDSQITGRVVGGRGRATLRSLRDADVPLGSQNVSNSPVGAVKLGQFDLVEGGAIDLTGGVRTVQLNAIGANTFLDLQSLPMTSSERGTLPAGTTSQITQFVRTANGTEVSLVQAGSTDGTTTAGDQAFETRTTVTGEIELIPVGGTPTTDQRTPPPGVNLLVDRIDGRPQGEPLANPQVFGYDPAANALVRFDARTGAALQVVPLTIGPAPDGDAGVALGRVDGTQVVVVGIGQSVQAFDVRTGAFVGDFSTANLAAAGFTTINGMARTEQGVALVDAAADLALPIDLERSLANPANEAVPTGPPTEPLPGFNLSGGATGVGGTTLGYLTGAAPFDTFQPDTPLFGVQTISTAGDRIRNIQRIQVARPADEEPPLAFGSIDLSPALVTNFDPARGNIVTLYNPNTLVPAGSVVLNSTNSKLTGLSESFHPELEGSALINVRGILNQLHAREVNGTVVNVLGYLAQIRANRASDSAFVGLPVGHVHIGQRTDVSIVSAATRPTGKRGGVFTVAGLQPAGPLALPRIQA